MKYFEYFVIGLEEEAPGRHVVTEEEIIEFGTRWDSQPFHVDPEAAKTSVFGGLVACSVHLFAMAIGLWNSETANEDRAAAVSALGFNNMQLKTPARPGDELKSKSTVIERRSSVSKPHLGIVTFRNEVTNQNGELVLVFENTALLEKEKDPAEVGCE
jgi:acyl dehydratase